MHFSKKFHFLLRWRSLLAMAAVASLALVVACSSDDDDGTGDAAPAATAAPVVQTIVQIGNPQAQPPADAAPSGWNTTWSEKIGFTLLETFDSSGDLAWSPADHSDVYFTSMGPGYSGILSDGNTLPGLAVFDAKTNELVASRTYDLGVESYFEPHGLGVSMDGRWAYLPTAVSAGFGDVGTGRWLVVDTQTLKIKQIIGTATAPHHASAFVDGEGNSRVLLYTFRGQAGVLDPGSDNQVVGSWDNGTLTASGYNAFANPTGEYIFVTIRPASGMESDGGIAVIDTKTWRVVKNISTHDPSPIWVEFEAGGEHAYVSNGHHSSIARIRTVGPPPTWELDGITQAGTAGPYGIRLNWDETQLWASGKGEGSHNRGQSIGLADPVRMPTSWGTPGEWPTGCLRNDHGTLNPVDKSELWLSCNSSFETVVWDMDAREVKARIPMPLGASTHSGSFVRYAPDFTGAMLSDSNGLHGVAFQEKAQALAVAAAAKAPPLEDLMGDVDLSDPISVGENVFQRTAGGIGCQFCHSQDASGGIGPRLIGRTSADIAGALDRVAAMQFINLTNEEIQAVAAYLVTLGEPGTTE